MSGNLSPPTTDSWSLGKISSHPPAQTSSNLEPNGAFWRGIRGLCQSTFVPLGTWTMSYILDPSSGKTDTRRSSFSNTTALNPRKLHPSVTLTADTPTRRVLQVI